MPSTLPQQRWSESQGVLVRCTSVFSRRRCSRFSGSAEPKYIDTPCCTTRYCSRIWSRTSSGRPPSTMKFSEMISNQSHDRLVLEDVVVVRNAQADADSVFGEAVEAIGRHSEDS